MPTWYAKVGEKVNDLPANVRQSLAEKIVGLRCSAKANTAVAVRERLADASSVSRCSDFSPQSRPVITKVKKPLRVKKPLPNEYCVGQGANFHIGNRRFEVLALSIALPVLLENKRVSEPDDFIARQTVDKWNSKGGRFLCPDPDLHGHWVPVLERDHAVTEICLAISNAWNTIWMNKLNDRLPTILPESATDSKDEHSLTPEEVDSTCSCHKPDAPSNDAFCVSLPQAERRDGLDAAGASSMTSMMANEGSSVAPSSV